MPLAESRLFADILANDSGRVRLESGADVGGEFLMTWGVRITVAVSALITWFAIASIYSEIGFKINPDGFARSITAIVLVGPAVAVAQTWALLSLYKSESNDLRRRQLMAAGIAVSCVLLVIASLVAD